MQNLETMGASENPVLDKLLEDSNFKRSNIEGPNCEIRQEDVVFTIAKVDPDDVNLDRLVEEMRSQLLAKVFDPAEVESAKTIVAGLKGQTAFGTIRGVSEQAYLLRDGDGHLRSMISGALVELKNEKGEPTGENVFMVGYCVTDPSARTSGLARELYTSMLIDSFNQSETSGRKFGLAAGECTPLSEHFWNKVGWRRIYRGNKEVEYVQPPLGFDFDTGEVADGAGESPEHLMVHDFNEATPLADDLPRLVKALYASWYRKPREAFANEEAYKKHAAYVDGLEVGITGQFIGATDLRLLSADEREALRQSGQEIIDYQAADKNINKVGAEDF